MSGEDVLLRYLFKRRMAGPPGVYVDIGCSVPFHDSDSYLFYCLGWSGVTIDLHGSYAARWAKDRPRDKFVHAAVSDVPGEVFVYGNGQNAGMDAISTSPTPPGPGLSLIDKVATRRLDDILNEALPPGTSIQFFSIDVEGSEIGVLRSNDWDKWRPEIILMECHEFTLEEPLKVPAVALLHDLGYVVDSKMHVNLFFRDTRSSR
jgi:FkbM family methyltransferase